MNFIQIKIIGKSDGRKTLLNFIARQIISKNKESKLEIKFSFKIAGQASRKIDKQPGKFENFFSIMWQSLRHGLVSSVAIVYF